MARPPSLSANSALWQLLSARLFAEAAERSDATCPQLRGPGRPAVGAAGARSRRQLCPVRPSTRPCSSRLCGYLFANPRQHLQRGQVGCGYRSNACVLTNPLLRGLELVEVTLPMPPEWMEACRRIVTICRGAHSRSPASAALLLVIPKPGGGGLGIAWQPLRLSHVTSHLSAACTANINSLACDKRSRPHPTSHQSRQFRGPLINSSGEVIGHQHPGAAPDLGPVWICDPDQSGPGWPTNLRKCGQIPP